MSAPTIGTTRCSHCTLPATAIYDGETVHVTCDECGFELWGKAYEIDPDNTVTSGEPASV